MVSINNPFANYFWFSIFVLISWELVSSNTHTDHDLLITSCLILKSPKVFPKIIHTPSSPSSNYLSVLRSSSRNKRFMSDSTPQPLIIVTPFHESQVQTVIHCSKKHGVRIRVRSGGHDYEGVSYVSKVPFLVIDLVNMRSIHVDVKDKSAWVEAGAILGELFYAIANKSNTLGFVAGFCPTIGVGGHLAGGGVGMMSRKFGLAADNVIDAKIIDVNGRILDRKSMGKDLFWAIRGAGSAGFGVITAWKIKLVDVPNVTVFNVVRTSEQNATQLIHRWQYVAPKMDKNIVIGMFIQSATSPKTGNRSIYATFPSMFLGKVNKLLALMRKDFPELGLVKDDCIEMSWIKSVLFFYYGNRQLPLDTLQNRTLPVTRYYKGKSDFMVQPISEDGITGILDWFHKEAENMGFFRFMPFGGRFDQISESKTPFPHRHGNIYLVDELIYWDDTTNADSAKHMKWLRDLHDYMTPFASKKPKSCIL